MPPPEVELFAWNALRSRPDEPEGSPKRPVNNFGDLLGPYIVTELLHRKGQSATKALLPRRLLSVGSVMHYARDGDVVWGTGINGKVRRARYGGIALDIRAVRGPLTAHRLRRAGHTVPSVYGDPGSLIGTLWTRDHFRRADLATPALVVPNFNDLDSLAWKSDHTTLLDPHSPVEHCLSAIASADLVVASSLHAIIVAEAFGVPAVRFKSATETDFKYEDYYRATGRSTHYVADSPETALAHREPQEAPNINTDRLLAAFPWDLWAQGEAGPLGSSDSTRGQQG